MKLVWRKHRFIIFLIFSFLIVIPLLILADQQDHFDSPPNATSLPIIISSLNRTNTCLKNTTANKYFIPTKTVGEWDAFNAHKPSGVTSVGCCGDHYCNIG